MSRPDAGHALVAGILAVTALSVACAQEATSYPDPRREVRHVIPWRAGGGTDSAMRGFAGYFEKALGVPVVTENVPGGLSSVGLTMVRNARPDGYTLGTMTYDVLTVEHLGLAQVAWTSFEPICRVTDHPSALMAPAGSWADVEALRRDASARPGEIRVGNVGTRGVWHQHAFAMERALGIELRHIPYEGGSGPQLAAILGGEVDAIVSSLPAALPYVREGTLKVLAVMASARSELVPDAPTFRELGYELEYGSFRILVAPGGTPEPILARLEAACRSATEDPGYVEWARSAAIGASWRDRDGTKAYLEALAPRVRSLMTELERR